VFGESIKVGFRFCSFVDSPADSMYAEHGGWRLNLCQPDIMCSISVACTVGLTDLTDCPTLLDSHLPLA
jgi:hypothetical protein